MCNVAGGARASRADRYRDCIFRKEARPPPAARRAFDLPPPPLRAQWPPEDLVHERYHPDPDDRTHVDAADGRDERSGRLQQRLRRDVRDHPRELRVRHARVPRHDDSHDERHRAEREERPEDAGDGFRRLRVEGIFVHRELEQRAVQRVGRGGELGGGFRGGRGGREQRRGRGLGASEEEGGVGTGTLE
eukprot:31191-Pelagococcus_subviridis.AAC.25